MKRENLHVPMEPGNAPMPKGKAQTGDSRKKPRWMIALAGLLIVAVAGGIVLGGGGHLPTASGYAIREAVYPEMAAYPDESSPDFERQYDAWWESVRAQRRPEGYADGLNHFWSESIPQFLAGEEGENKVYSPLNVYLALGMLAELTDGDSRQQILDLLGEDSMGNLRTQAEAVWNAQYRNDGATTCILASSLWLDEDVQFVSRTLQRLADTYYASSYRGAMGSEEFNKELQNWINRQTGGLLTEQTQTIRLDADTVLALATTIQYHARWAGTFDETLTAPGNFHGTDGDVACDFMHDRSLGTYYWGEHFGAVARPLENGGGTMWIILPDEGISLQQLLGEEETMEFLLCKGDWTDSKYLNINLSLPRFDVSSQTDLCDGLQALGVTDVFDETRADFSPMAANPQGIYLSQAKHGVRVAVDEEGVTAAAYTVMAMSGSGMPPEDEMDFTVDRPFLFAITSDDGLPLFVGSVYQPAA